MRCATKTAGIGAWLAALSISCGDGGQIGQTCQLARECANDLQCFAGICTPQCATHADCGDGFRCDDGECAEVSSQLGDRCVRELDCAVQQTCLVFDVDPDGDGRLESRCVRQLPGAAMGTSCVIDADCRSGSCNIGRCTEVCAASEDCSGPTTCTDIPRLIEGGAPLFRGCFQDGGSLALDLPLVSSHGLVGILVPGNARSIAITVRTEATLIANISFLATPSGQAWFRPPLTPEAFLGNPIRYLPGGRESTMLIPNRPELSLTAGRYSARIGSSFVGGVEAAVVPSARVLYKLGDDNTLDVNVYILNLSGHPCADDIGSSLLTSLSAPRHSGMISFTSRLESILATAGIELGGVAFKDIDARPDLDALDRLDLDDLLALGEGKPGLNLFLVRSIEPHGVQVLSGGSPGTPRFANSVTAGVALSMDTLCYRSWPTVARLVAHAFGRQMGLFRNREPDSTIEDPIFDSSIGSENLMFFAEFGGSEISDGQAEILLRYPGLR